MRFYIAGGGGAGLYDLRPYERSIFSSRSNGFAVIDADATQLTVSLVDTSGKAVYRNDAEESHDGVGASGPSVSTCRAPNRAHLSCAP